jgi:DNA-binding MarR family transcriptional regulator
MTENKPVSGCRELDRQTVARLVARIHRLIGDTLGRDIFSTPAWDMMLDLYIRDEQRPLSLTGLCGASAVPERTALFTINRLVERKLLTRYPDPTDGRRANVELSAGAVRLLDDCFDDLLALIRHI